MKLTQKHFAKLILVLLLSAPALNIQAQEINWLGFEEAIEKSKEEPKKIIIDLYTDWCRWCKVMDNKTFSHPVIAKYINENYYAVKFNAESTKPVNFKGQKFINQERGNRSPHDLAVALTNGKLSYPTYVFMNERHEIIQPLNGYIKAKKFEPIIHYINEELYLQNKPFDEFLEEFDSDIN